MLNFRHTSSGQSSLQLSIYGHLCLKLSLKKLIIDTIQLDHLDKTYFFEQSLKLVVTIFSAWPAELVTRQTYSPLSLSDNCFIRNRPESSTSTLPLPRPAGKTAPKYQNYLMEVRVKIKPEGKIQLTTGVGTPVELQSISIVSPRSA